MTDSSVTWRRAIFVDSSAFFVVLNANDSSHRDAQRMLTNSSAQGQVLVTSNFVLAETHALFIRRLGRDTAARVLTTIRAGLAKIIRVEPADEERAVEFIERYADKAFSYTDATSFAVMERLGVETSFTFDRHFAQFGVAVPEAADA